MKQLFMAILALAMASTANAQHQKAHRPQKQALMHQLNLSEAQRSQLKANHEQFRAQLQALNKNEQMTLKAYRDQKQTLRKAHKTALLALLTPEQRAQLQQAQDQRKVQKELRAGQRIDRMTRRLQLTDLQVQQLQQQRANFRSQLLAIKNNQQLDRTQRKEQLLALKNEQKTQMANLLTPAQKEKLRAWRQKRPPTTSTQ